MGCFIGCFGSSKDRKRRKQRYKVIPRDQNPKTPNLVEADVSLVQSIKELPSNSLPESRSKEEPVISSTRKKVTFDTHVTTYEHVEVYDSTESLLEKNENGEAFPKSGPQTGSDVSGPGSYPPGYRYGNCLESDDEIEVSDYEDEENEALDDEDAEDGVIREDVWCESIPIPSMESTPESSVEPASIGSNVLNPVENLTQWKALKSRRIPPPFNPQQKENSSLNSTPKNQEIAVDASLSNWLPSIKKPEVRPILEEKSILLSGSKTSIEDRPILGALTIDEMRQFSAPYTPPRKSPGRSPDEMPIIGSVGSYWRHSDSDKSGGSYKGIPNTTSKYREDKKVNWHNTPFEERLERALNASAGEV